MQHLTQCQDPTAIVQWELVSAKMDDWLQATNMTPQLHYDIVNGLWEWQKDQHPSISDNMHLDAVLK